MRYQSKSISTFDSKRQGFMLVEVIISIVIIGIVLISMLGVFTTVLQSIFSVRDADESHLIAIGVINDMESLDFSDISGDIEILDNGFRISRNIKFFDISNVETNLSKDKAYAMITVKVRREDGRDGDGITMTRRISRNAYRNVGEER